MKEQVTIDCKGIGKNWSLYVDKASELEFCYDINWGKPVPSLSTSYATAGKLWYINFPDELDKTKAPLISYQTLDYQKSGDSDVPVFNWDLINFSLSENELLDTLYPDYMVESSRLTKTKINGKDALKVDLDFIEPLSYTRIQMVEYYIPKVMKNDNYNLRVAGYKGIKDNIEDIIDQISF